MLGRVCYWTMADLLLKYDIGPVACSTPATGFPFPQPGRTGARALWTIVENTRKGTRMPANALIRDRRGERDARQPRRVR
jgi:hypothetical protein